MANINWVYCRGAATGASPTAIDGAIAFGHTDASASVEHVVPGVRTTIPVGPPRIEVSVLVRDNAQAAILLEKTAAENFVGKYVDLAGALKKRTYLNVRWLRQQEVTVTLPTGQEMSPACRIDGICNVAVADTRATLMVDAADS
jgi:hypothetical protein